MLKDKLKKVMYYVLKYSIILCTAVQIFNFIVIVCNKIFNDSKKVFQGAETLYSCSELPIKFKVFVGMSSLSMFGFSILALILAYVLKQRKTINVSAFVLMVLSLFMFGLYFMYICTL